LALEALGAALAQRGRPALTLGASVPAASVIAALGRRPDVKVVVLWSQIGSTADAEAVRAVAAAGAQVMVAGPGWAKATLPAGVAQLTTLRAAVERLLDVP
jgi:succinyl-CoA synthetase alpha subunit